MTTKATTNRRISAHLLRLKSILALASLFGVLPCIAQAQSLTRGPYLQNQSTSAVSIRWRTSSATNSVVKYGTSPSNLNLTATDAASVTDHEIRLTGLPVGSTYYYSVGYGTTTLASGTDCLFTTSPAGAAPTRIWVLGDAGTGSSGQLAVRDAFYNWTGTRDPNLVLQLGDNAYNSGTDSEYQSALFNIYGSLMKRVPFWSCLGNHETGQSTSYVDTYPYFSIYTFPKTGEAGGVASGTEHYYSFDYGNIHFISLDSQTADRSPTGAMATWLTNDLASTTANWVICFFHHPPYTKGSHNSDSETSLIQMRQNILPILEAGGVDLVLCGHSHSYERSKFIDGHYGLSTTFSDATMVVQSGNGQGAGAYTKSSESPASHAGAVYAVPGSSGQTSGGSLNHPAMVTSLNVLGSLALDISSTRLDATFLDNTGAVRDTFTMLKGSNALPTVNITSPANGSIFPAPANITINANASDSDGTVSKVDFYQGTTLLGTDTTSPYSFDWNNVEGGNYSLTAVATDNSGGFRTSTAVSVAVPLGAKTWTNAAGGSWVTGTNWSGGTIASGAGATADFSTLNLAANATVTLDGARTVGGLIFGDTTPSHNWTLNTGSGGPLTLDEISGTPAITVNNQTTTISVVLAGSEGLNKAGTGTLVLTGSNTYTGTTTVSAGTLSVVTKTLASGSGVNIASGATLTTTGQLATNANSSGVFSAVTGSGTLALRSTTNSATSPDINFNANDATNSTSNWGTSIATAVDLGSSQRYVWGRTNHNSVSQYLQSAGADANFTGPITGSGGLTFIAQHNYTGTNPMEVPFVLSGSNTFTGMVEIQRGSVYLNHANALAQGNALLLNPASGNNARFFLYGRNASVSNLSSSGAGSASIANGNLPTGAATALGTGTLTVNETSATTYAGTLVDHIAEYNKTGSNTQGPLALVKAGPATLTLTGANTYTGTTQVNGGTLLINGSLANTATTVASSGALGGTGTIGGAVTVQSGGSMAPGANGIGTLTVNNTVSLAGTTTMEISKSGATLTADKVSGVSTVTYGGSLVVTNVGPDALVVNNSFQLFSATTRTGSFSNITLPALGSGLAWDTTQLSVNGTISVTASANIPPTASITSPANGANYTAPASITINANASDSDGSVTKVDFYQDATLIGTDTSSPYSVTWSNVGAGTYSLTAVATDNATATTTSSAVSVTVNAPGNNPPTFTSNPITGTAGTEDSAYSGTLAGSATDPDAGDTLTYSKVSGPAWLSVAANGALSGTPGNSNVGANSFTVRVSDAVGANATATLNITVINVNDAPVFTANPISRPNANPGVAYSASIAGAATDEDAGDTLTYSKVSGPAWLSVASNGALTGTPATGDLGANAWTVRVTDALGATADATLNITVTAPSLPPGWASGDIGSVGIAGSASESGGTYTVSGSGNDIWNTADAFQFASQTLLGDGEIRARVTSQTNTDPWAKAGVMIRDGSSAGAINVFAAVTPGNGFRFQNRPTAGAASVSAGGPALNPAPNNWVRLTRSGTLVTAYASANGTNWTQIGTVNVTMANSVSVGLAVTSHNNSVSSTATFDNVSVTPFPAPWLTSDIGTTGLQGSAEYFGSAYSVKGAGTVGGNSDKFRFVYQTLSGDGEITARINAPGNTGSGARIGVMIRDTLTTDSPFAFMGVDGGSNYYWQRRKNIGSGHSTTAGGSGTAPNLWVRVVRTGNTFRGYKSTDGVNWTIVNSLGITMGSNIYVGLVVSSGDTTTLNTSVMDNVTVAP